MIFGILSCTSGLNVNIITMEYIVYSTEVYGWYAKYMYMYATGISNIDLGTTHFGQYSKCPWTLVMYLGPQPNSYAFMV